MPARHHSLVKPLVQALGTTDDVPANIARLAQSMTEALRNSPNSTAHGGDAYVWKAYVHVRWAWLALPIGLVVSSLILLLVTIWDTRSTRIGFWKSSAVATLLHRLEGWSDEDLEVSTSKDLLLKSKSMQGRVSEEDGKLLVVREAGPLKPQRTTRFI